MILSLEYENLYQELITFINNVCLLFYNEMFYDMITYDYRLILIKSYELNQIRDDENSPEIE